MGSTVGKVNSDNRQSGDTGDGGDGDDDKANKSQEINNFNGNGDKHDSQMDAKRDKSNGDYETKISTTSLENESTINQDDNKDVNCYDTKRSENEHSLDDGTLSRELNIAQNEPEVERNFRKTVDSTEQENVSPHIRTIAESPDNDKTATGNESSWTRNPNLEQDELKESIEERKNISPNSDERSSSPLSISEIKGNITSPIQEGNEINHIPKTDDGSLQSKSRIDSPSSEKTEQHSQSNKTPMEIVGDTSGDRKKERVTDVNIKSQTKDNSKYNLLVCYLCKRQYKDPRLLPCYHTFCSLCLGEHIMSNYENNTINCPLCNEKITIPETGAKGFQKNTYLESSRNELKPNCGACKGRGIGIARCDECQKTLCKSCSVLHTKDDTLKGHSVVFVDKLEVSPKCKQHLEKVIFLYCLKCQQPICEICNMTKHKMHETQDIDSLVREIKDSLLETLEHPNRSKNINDIESNMESENKRLRNLEKETLGAIEEHAKLLCNLVMEVKSELGADVMAAISDCDTQLNNGVIQANKFKASVSSRFHFGDRFVHNADKIEIAQQGSLLNKYLLGSLNRSLDFQSTENVKFEPNKVYVSDIARLFGKVYPNKASLSRSEGKVLKIFNTFTSSVGGGIVTGLSPMIDGTVWVCLGNDRVLEHYDQNGELLSSTNIDLPLDDVIGRMDGTLYISCNSSKKIITVDSLGKGKTFIRTDYCPRGLALDEESNCLVGLTEKPAFFDTSDNVDGVVSCITSGRQLRTSLRSKDIQYPARIAINKDQSIVISDWIQLAVFVFKNNEELGCYKGNPDMSDDFIPRGICCRSDGDIIVVDIASNCLHLLSYDAVFKRVLSELETIEEPWSVAVDKSDNLWIGSQNGNIHFAKIL